MTARFGEGDATYRAAGGEEGIHKLVNDFYDIMDTDPAYQRIRDWHESDLAVPRDKLARFLCGWMGGPRRYTEKYGKISIPEVHAHLAVTELERDLWLACMRAALGKQNYARELQTYLLRELGVPAERIRQHQADAFTTSSE